MSGCYGAWMLWLVGAILSGVMVSCVMVSGAMLSCAMGIGAMVGGCSGEWVLR